MEDERLALEPAVKDMEYRYNNILKLIDTKCLRSYFTKIKDLLAIISNLASSPNVQCIAMREVQGRENRELIL